MTRSLRSLLAALLATCLMVGGTASAVDDEFLGLLLETQREVNEAIDEVLAERDAISGRIESDDWLVFPTSNGVVEVDLNDLDGYIPLAQQMLASDAELKATVIETLKQANPEAWKALTLLDFVGIENVPSTAISAWMRAQFGQTADDKRRAYEDRFAKLNDEFLTLVALERDISHELIRLQDGAAASPSASAGPSAGPADRPSAQPSVEPSAEPTPGPVPSSCPESDMWCDDSAAVAGVEYDALKGLTNCDEGDEACDGQTFEPDWEVSLPPTEQEVLPSSRPDADDPFASAGFYLGDWQTDIGRLHIEKAGSRLAGTLRSAAGVAQVDVVEADERYLEADFYGPIDAPWLSGWARGEAECSEARRGTTYWGTLGLRPWGDSEVRGYWAPCDAEWQRRADLYNTTWVNDIAGTRIVGDHEPASDGSIDDWNGVWSTDLGELELTVFRGWVNGSFGDGAREGFRHAWMTLHRQADDPRSIAGKWMGEYGTRPCPDRLEGADYWGNMSLEFDESGDGFTGDFDYCAEGDGGSISGHMIARTSPPQH